MLRSPVAAAHPPYGGGLADQPLPSPLQYSPLPPKARWINDRRRLSEMDLGPLNTFSPQIWAGRVGAFAPGRQLFRFRPRNGSDSSVRAHSWPDSCSWARSRSRRRAIGGIVKFIQKFAARIPYPDAADAPRNHLCRVRIHIPSQLGERDAVSSLLSRQQ